MKLARAIFTRGNSEGGEFERAEVLIMMEALARGEPFLDLALHEPAGAVTGRRDFGWGEELETEVQMAFRMVFCSSGALGKLNTFGGNQNH